jgi:hypothetical protein
LIHHSILLKVQEELERVLIDEIADDDDTAVGIVKLGPLDGDPEPDEARISITLHENDPDTFISGALTGMSGAWNDELEFAEIGGSNTWKRKFSIKGVFILETSQEALVDARRIASTVRTRIEQALPQIDFSGISSNGEYVSSGIWASDVGSEMIQGGGPPDSYAYYIKIRFAVMTTANLGS